jgi:glycosyltransferase involved in cell wall biosynthesis
MTPRISVLMAVRHPAPHIEPALHSIDAQAFAPHEVILIEAGATEFPLVTNASLHRIHQTGSGLAQAWNQAIEAATGDWIAWLDSDDIWSPDALAAHAQALSQAPAAGVSVGNVRFFLDGDTLPAGFRPELLEGSHRAFMPGTSLVHREAVARVGPFREDLGVATDIEWFARLRDTVPAVETREIVLHKRVHETNLSYTSAVNGDYSAALLATVRSRLQGRGGAP